jgi:hypothetical protein
VSAIKQLIRPPFEIRNTMKQMLEIGDIRWKNRKPKDVKEIAIEKLKMVGLIGV